MKEITVEPIKTERAEVATGAAEQALTLVKGEEITSQKSYEDACNFRRNAKGRIKELETMRKEITGPLDIAKKKVMDLFRKPTDIYQKIVEICNKGTITWDAKQEEIRIAQQEKLNRQAEAERKKKEEQTRVWKEKEAAKRREAEALEAEGKKEEAAKARAEAEKSAVKAEERQEAANGVIAPVIGLAVGKVAGTHYMEKWYGEVTDIKALMEAVLQLHAPANLIMADESAVNKLATATKGTQDIPGIRFYPKKIPVDRG